MPRRVLYADQHILLGLPARCALAAAARFAAHDGAGDAGPDEPRLTQSAQQTKPKRRGRPRRFCFQGLAPTRIDRQPKTNAPLRLIPDDYARLAARCAPKGRSRSMRSVVCALALLTLPTSAFAGDFDILRGTVPTYRWSGFYAGGDFGYSAANVDFGQAAGPDIANMLRNSAIEQDQQISQWPLLSGNSFPQ